MVEAGIFIVCSAGFGFSPFDIFLLLPAFRVGDFLSPCELVGRVLRHEQFRNGWLVFIILSMKTTAFPGPFLSSFWEIFASLRTYDGRLKTHRQAA